MDDYKMIIEDMDKAIQYLPTVDQYNDIIAHGRYYYDRHAGGFLIIDEKTGLPYKGVGTFRYENGLIMSGSTTYVLYK